MTLKLRSLATLACSVAIGGCPAPEPFVTAGAPVTSTIGAAGGSFTLTADAITATLEVPENALVEDTELSMQELVAFTLVPLDDVRGVKLGPSGLTFLAPVTLTLESARGFSLADDAAYVASDDGSDLE